MWHEVLRAAPLAKHQALIAFFFGDPNGHPEAIKAAMTCIKLGGSWACTVCHQNIAGKGHSADCWIALAYADLDPTCKQWISDEIAGPPEPVVRPGCENPIDWESAIFLKGGGIASHGKEKPKPVGAQLLRPANNLGLPQSLPKG